MPVATNVYLSQSTIITATCVRVAALSIAAYDYLITLPWEFWFYTSSHQFRSSLILFILIRYSSIIVMVLSSVGFFYPHFTPNTCGHYFYATLVFKEVQLMASQAILGIRTYSISLYNIWVGRMVFLAYFVAVAFQWVSVLIYRIPVMPVTPSGQRHGCIIGTSHPGSLIGIWFLYLVAMLYDCLVLSIATYYLLKMKAAGMSTTSKLMRILIYDGLAYVVALTAVNVVNIILNRRPTSTIQSIGAPFSYVAIWIMSQRLLIHPRAAAKQSSLVVTTPIAPRVTLSVTPLKVSSKNIQHAADSPYTPDSLDVQSDVEQQVFDDRSEGVDTNRL